MAKCQTQSRVAIALMVGLACQASSPAHGVSMISGARTILPAQFIPFTMPSLNASDLKGNRTFGSLTERTLSYPEKRAPLSEALVEAILRIESVYDPTRVGVFGPALRMKIRPGTASLESVSGDRWRRLSVDPNVHFRVEYVALGWLALHEINDCAELRKFRPSDTLVMIDNISPDECEDVFRAQRRGVAYEDVTVSKIVPEVPLFAAPFPGARFSREGLIKIQHEIALEKLRDKRPGWLRRFSASAAF